MEKHNAAFWITEFQEAPPMQKRILRSQIFHQSYRLSELLGKRHRSFVVPEGVTELDSLLSKTLVEDSESRDELPFVAEEFQGRHQTEVTVIPGDCVDVAIERKLEGYNPALLSMAHAYNPGGGVEGGTESPEEGLCRRSNLMLGLESIRDRGIAEYRIPELGVNWTPHVQFFRKGEEEGYAFCCPTPISVISSAAFNLKAPRGHGGPPTDYGDYAKKTKAKIRGIFRCAAMEGHDCLTLSAFGCGEFGNDPSLIAEFFKNVMEEDEFSGTFKRVDFVISESRVLDVFSDRLKK